MPENQKTKRWDVESGWVSTSDASNGSLQVLAAGMATFFIFGMDAVFMHSMHLPART